ncbi:MAG: MarR family transcriptional regulator [Neisseriaceae bacterium]|nr:MarR family transcriptional regulator [Neisseriaceae bacterium]MBP6861686.1 MarR family transcriptional regulator [Neisseriaceae bacterium]
MNKNAINNDEFFSIGRGPLGYLLRQAANVYRTRMETALQPMDVTGPQFTILKIIAQRPDCSNADVARLALLTPQTVSLIVAKLADLGLVEKEAHPVYKRVQVLRITVLGQSVLAECDVTVDGLEADLLVGFSDAEMAVVRRWIAHVIEPHK